MMDQIFQGVCPFPDFLLAKPEKRQREKHRAELKRAQKGQFWFVSLHHQKIFFPGCFKSIHKGLRMKDQFALQILPGIPDLTHRNFGLQSSFTSHGLEINFPGKMTVEFIFILCLAGAQTWNHS